jgi:DNA-binding transcriptional ArsR family regulator
VRPRQAAPLFAALGDATRLAIVRRLCDEGPRSIVQLTQAAQVSRQAVSKHLRALQAAGLARSDRQGRERVWQIRPQRLLEARRYLQEISDQWDEALQRLKDWVEPH